MQIKISDSDGTPIYAQVVNQIKLLVASERLAVGEQLPAVRRLAEQLVINPNTVARAYRELENEGVVKSKRGAGVFVSGESSPLSRKEKTRILTERIDVLLTEAKQLGVEVATLVGLLEQRAKTFEKGKK